MGGLLFRSSQPASITQSSVRQQTTSSSIDPEDLKNFQKLSTSWWVENGEFEPLHRMNQLRVPWIRETMVNYKNLNNRPETSEEQKADSASEPLSGLRILDVGCGGGILSEPLARLGASVTAIDSCKENILAAQLRVSNEMEQTNNSSKLGENLTYINCTLEDLASVEDNDNYFDAIVMSEVVEHVNNLSDFMRNSSRLLKNHGFAFVTTINRTNASYLLAILGAEYVLNLVPRGTHQWEKFVTPEEIKKLLEENHCSVKFEMGMFFNPLTKNWSWINDKGCNYAVYAQKFQTH